MDEFHSREPIFTQIRQRMIALILDRHVGEGQALPSVRQIAAELSVNPLTVTRAFDTLVELGAIEPRRGLGMFVRPGARKLLLEHERSKFLLEDWPRIAMHIRALDLDPEFLLSTVPARARVDE